MQGDGARMPSKPVQADLTYLPHAFQRSGVLLAQINGKDTRLWTVDMCMSAFKVGQLL